MIRVGVLTSSRADYGIYLPLLKVLINDKDFNLRMIVFGTHLSTLHGYTLSQIESDGFFVYRKIESILLGDTPNAISSSYALTALKFSEFWEENHFEFDIVFALGDRFEMAAAVAASLPYQVKIAHIHGGETTLGAIDNTYRHCISLSSALHFVSSIEHKNRLIQLLSNNYDKIFNVGALSLENLNTMPLLTVEEFNEKWQINLRLDTILVTVHPETVAFEHNKQHCIEVCLALKLLSAKYQIIITMPNTDTASMVYRFAFEELGKSYNNIKVIENLGTESYFTCMKYSKLLIGNTSSGIIEAASFKKYVLNLGNRQSGRVTSENVVNLPFNSDVIVSEAKKYFGRTFTGENIYYKTSPASNILLVLKKYYESL